MRRTLAAVLTRQLSPHLKPAVTTPTIVPVTTTTTVGTSPVATISAAQTMPVIPTSQAVLNTTTTSEPTIAACLLTSPIATVTVSHSSAPALVNVESPPSAQAATSQPSEVINESGIPIGRDITIDTSGQQFMSLPDLTKIFNKSCSRRNMAANLVRALFNEDNSKQCNVSGRGKEMLDSVVVGFVKNVCFQFFPLSGSEKQEDEWGKCVVSIDESSRRLRNKPRKQKPQKEQ